MEAKSPQITKLLATPVLVSLKTSINLYPIFYLNSIIIRFRRSRYRYFLYLLEDLKSSPCTFDLDSSDSSYEDPNESLSEDSNSGTSVESLNPLSNTNIFGLYAKSVLLLLLLLKAPSPSSSKSSSSADFKSSSSSNSESLSKLLDSLQKLIRQPRAPRVVSRLR